MKLSYVNLLSAAAVSFIVCGSGNLFAQTTATQTFTVTVPQALQITAPTAATLTHDGTSNNQTFTPQPWVVSGNATNGVTVNFGVISAFTNTTDATYKRDATLTLATGTTTGPATWNITTATATTNYATSNEVATVTAKSNGLGQANMLLTVSFVTGNFTSLKAGNYLTTVTGTIAAN